MKSIDGDPVEVPSQLSSVHSDLGLEIACRLPDVYRHLAVQVRLFGNDEMRQVDLRMLALQEHFDIWKALALRSLVSCGRANDNGVVDALLEGVPLNDQASWMLFLDQCHKNKTPFMGTLAFCFIRWQGQARQAAYMKPRKPARRKTKRARR